MCNEMIAYLGCMGVERDVQLMPEQQGVDACNIRIVLRKIDTLPGKII